jgi:hypothetical protein
MNKKNHSIIGMEFQYFKQIDKLVDYTKVSDTTIYENNLDPKHGILHLRNQINNLIIFKSISRDSIENIIYKISDTLIIKSLNKPELITIGYCQINEDNNENIIAIIEKTDSIKVQNIKKAWKANTTSSKIEIINKLDGINCWNEYYTE